MKNSADVTRSPRQRAGSRRNKRLRNVGTFTSDQRHDPRRIDHQKSYSAIKTGIEPLNVLAVRDPVDHAIHMHISHWRKSKLGQLLRGKMKERKQ